MPKDKQAKVPGLASEDDWPHIQEFLAEDAVFVNAKGEMNMTLNLQYLTPNVNVVAL